MLLLLGSFQVTIGQDTKAAANPATTPTHSQAPVPAPPPSDDAAKKQKDEVQSDAKQQVALAIPKKSKSGPWFWLRKNKDQLGVMLPIISIFFASSLAYLTFKAIKDQHKAMIDQRHTMSDQNQTMISQKDQMVEQLAEMVEQKAAMNAQLNEMKEQVRLMGDQLTKMDRQTELMGLQKSAMDRQTTAQQHTLRLQARLTQLNQVKLRLETLQRGDTMSLRDNSLPTGRPQNPAPQLTDEQKAWITLVVSQICGDSPTAKHKHLVTELATQWVLLEQGVQDAYDEVERSLKP